MTVELGLFLILAAGAACFVLLFLAGFRR